MAAVPERQLSGPLLLGVLGAVVCFFACTQLKNMLGYDDALDVVGVHAVGGMLGALLITGLAVTGIGFLIVPPLISQTQELLRSLPGPLAGVEAIELTGRIDVVQHAAEVEEARLRIRRIVDLPHRRVDFG